MTHFPYFLRTPKNFSEKYLHNTKSKFLFHHIPKTAGSTLRGILSTFFKESEICHAETVDELNTLKKNDFLKYRFFAGHFSYGAIEKYLPDAIWITFLREPNERIISQYYNHINQDRIPWEWKERVKANPEWNSYMQQIQGCSLEEWFMLNNEHSNRITCNRQTQAFLPQKIRVKVKDWSIHNDQLIKIAKKNLTEKFVFFGIQEYFDISFQLFSSTFGLHSLLNSKSFSTNINKNKNFGSKYKVDKQLTKKINARNSMDWELYNYAKGLFFKRLNKAVNYYVKHYDKNNGDLLSKNIITEKNISENPFCESEKISNYIKLDRFRKMTEYLKTNNNLRNNQSSSKWDIDQIIGTNGVHFLEKKFLRFKYRWTGLDKTAFLEINKFLKKNIKYQVVINFAAYMDPKILQSLTIMFNLNPVSHSIKLKDFFSFSNKITFNFIPSKDYYFNMIEINSQYVAVDEYNYKRDLGIALTSIEVKKINV